MLNPREASKTPFSSRIAFGIALLLAGSFGLAVAVMVPNHTPPPVAQKSLSANDAKIRTSLEQDSGKEAPAAVSTDDLVKFCAQHVTAARTFVVFSRGTCVVVNEPSSDPLADAKRKLSACADPNTPFIPEPTAEGDLIVSFREPVFQRFTREEMDKLAPALEKLAPALLSPAESVAAGADWTPPDQAKVGLLARRRMLEDASSVVPVRIIRAKNSETAAR
ncbi:hypothetical protein [Luteolibacter luteus]|uniref:Uncharacterized protein n=1 Tax=Luteolibacter luteus TaxID=2728835 RepID=A0A858RGB8_9BACT|nr:hypothetical protein [Luteolibacter luteus]QJE95588.1 hypothetical protein HHL09_07235 [Luteolibacter luteus]